MADKPAKRKRIVKNPETFRERAIKATEASDKLGTVSRVRGYGGKALKPITQPVGRVAGKAAKKKPVKWLAKPFKLIGWIVFPTYLRNSWKELKLVTWPSWKQSRQLTFAVLIFAAVFGAAVAVVDYGLDKVFKSLLLK